MKVKSGGTRGSITIFLSMVLVATVSFVTVFLEYGRISMVQQQMERNLLGSMDALLTEYYKPLYEDYRLFFLDKGITGESLEYRKLEKKIREYMEGALSTASSGEILGLEQKQNGIDLFSVQIENLQVDSAIRASAYNGSLFVDQVLQYMKYEVLTEGLEKVMEQAGIMEHSQVSAELMEEHEKTNESFQKANDILLELMELVEGITCDGSGLLFHGSKIYIQPYFAKKMCAREITMTNVGITDGTVWNSTKDKYVNPVECLEEMLVILSQVEDETKGASQGASEVNQLQEELEKIVNGTLEIIEKAKSKIEKLSGQYERVSEAAEGYQYKVEEKKDQLSKEEYEGFADTVREINQDVDAIEQAVAMYEPLITNEKILQGLQAELKVKVTAQADSINEKKSQLEFQIDSFRSYAIHTMCFSYGEISNETTKDPTKLLENLGGGILYLVLEDPDSLSDKKFENADYYANFTKSKKKKKTDVSEVAKDGEVKDLFGQVSDAFGEQGTTGEASLDLSQRLLFQAYILEYFKSYTTEKGKFEKTPLEYEQEYILCGEKSDKKNLEEVINRISLLRTVTNFTYLLTDPAAKKQAYGTAALLVGFTGIEPLVRLTQMTILLTWAYEEALVDTAALLQGYKVPVIKNKNTFALSYTDLFQISRTLIQQKAKEVGKKKQTQPALSYGDYLNLFLVFESQEKKTYRTMDLIEANIKLRHSEKFSFETGIYALKVNCTYCVPAKFTTWDFFSGWEQEKGVWRLHTTQSYSY